MGNNNSRHAVHDRQVISSTDIRRFTNKLEKVLNDPSYIEGVDTQSILDTVSDVFRVCRKGHGQIKLPLPINKIGPFTHMVFDTSADITIADLNIKHKKKRSSTLSTMPVAQGRLRQRYNIANNISNTPDESRDNETNSIINDINDAIEDIQSNNGDTVEVNKDIDASDDYDIVIDDTINPTTTRAIDGHIVHKPLIAQEDTIVVSNYGPRRIRRNMA